MFNDIAVRANGQRILMDWFNSLRTAGVQVEALLGVNYIPEGTLAVGSSVGTPTDITGLRFDKAFVGAAQVFVYIHRRTVVDEVVAFGKISAIYRAKSDTWELIPQIDGDDPLIQFFITAQGQVQYTSQSIGSTTGYVGNVKFKAITFAAI